MVYLDSSSAESVVCALNTIYSELVIAKERLATDTENVQKILTNLPQTYAGIMESTESLSAFWSLTDRQAITWALQNYSKTFGGLKNMLKPRTIGKTADVGVKAALQECQSCHMGLLLRVGALLSGHIGYRVHDVPREQLAGVVTVV